MLADYIPILVLCVIGGAVAFTTLLLSHFFGPHLDSKWKRRTFECGSDPIGSAQRRFSVKFYVVAVLFLVFDIETIFILPWAVIYRQLGVVGFVEMVVFITILFVGLIYVWRKGGLEWE